MSTNSTRAVAPSNWRRRAQVVLAVGAVLAVGTAFGPAWLNYIGIGVAVVAGVIAAILVWQQVRSERRLRSQQAIGFAHAQTEALHAERTQHSSVLDTMREHNQSASDRLTAARQRLAEVTDELNSARGESAALRVEIQHLKSTINKLRKDLAVREDEIRALTEDDAELVAMPRRVKVSVDAEMDLLPKADELWESGEYPTVVDLQTLAVSPVEDRRRQA